MTFLKDGGRRTEGSGQWGHAPLLPAVLCFLSSICLLVGCAYYSTSATGGGGIRSVAVPLLENESLEAGIHQALTDSLIQAFVTDGALRVVDEDQADAVLQGTVLEVKEEPFTYGDQADQYQITIFIRAALYDPHNKQVIWEEKRLRGYGIYSATEQREEARTQGLGDAFRMVTQDVVDRTQVGGW